ncbi:uncharacterized protein PADG_02406 [Paracoccidioides brasiliensis Pb18]|uniref:Uncharacterized protein n=2 Tax=Paracoccidioides brasiliensis TaxID=121759 RepID=C1G5F1_PARBD|nr:uncharacterized protein PADG_02406 [Paracoccidioides brasiliensis Pb18]EEH46308.2 hypothetical protein PADG_02406 [Paracoccidioides brasiliensis Pb18]ODH29599.1 hypothetical protein ACO22_03703 [Paracoccidioides brasiliensis]ODH52465.1 hypothetical protein GX48_01245 [Paracoccidioides brasiliensis]
MWSDRHEGQAGGYLTIETKLVKSLRENERSARRGRKRKKDNQEQIFIYELEQKDEDDDDDDSGDEDDDDTREMRPCGLMDPPW